MYFDEDGIVTAILIIVVSVLVFLALREFWTWYFKINRIVKNQEEQTAILADIRRMMKDDRMEEMVKSTPNHELLTPTPPNASNFKADEMIRLNKLRELGEIDDIEFHRQQKKILG